MRHAPNDADLIGGIRRALETNDVVVSPPRRAVASITREQALTTEYLMKRTVLFRADASHGIADMVGNTYDGQVISVDETARTAMVCYLYGHRSNVDDVKFDNLLAVLDKEHGIELTIGRFSGPSIDLRT